MRESNKSCKRASRAFAIFSVYSALGFAFPKSVAFASSMLRATDTQASFEKNAAQYCPTQLDEAQQSKLFSRMLNLGASYTHGCTQCDTGSLFRAQVLADGEFPYLRRNYLIHFLNQGNFKNKSEFNFEFYDVLENDLRSNYSVIFDQETLRREGYNGKWSYFPAHDSASLTTPGLEEYAQQSPGYVDEKSLVGSAFVRRNYKERELSRRGHVYQTVPGKHFEDGARQKFIFDLSLDKSRSFEIMKAYGDEKLYKKLVKEGWRNQQQREDLITKTTNYILSMQPSAIFAVDILFWDAVPYLFSYAREQNPKSFITKFISSKFFSQLLDLSWHDSVQRENMIADFYDVLARVSVGTQNSGPVPVFLGRLIESPGKLIQEKGLEKEFGALIGSFIEVFTDRDFTTEIIEQLKKLGAQRNRDFLFLKLPFLQPLRNIVRALEKSRIEQKQSIPGSVDDSNEFQSEKESFELFNDLNENDMPTNDEWKKIENALADAETIVKNQVQRSMIEERAFGKDNGTKPGLPWIVRGAVNAAIFNALGDLPLLIDSADRAFSYQNRWAKLAAINPNNNIQLLNVDEFYENFPKVVNKHTMHPSIEGAKSMAGMIERALCKSVGPTA